MPALPTDENKGAGNVRGMREHMDATANTVDHGATQAPNLNERTPEFVLDLSRVGKDDLARAGGKGSNLGELIRAGFPVPPGFVVTTAAYDRFVAANDLASLVPAAPRDPDGGAALGAAFERAAIPPE